MLISHDQVTSFLQEIGPSIRSMKFLSSEVALTSINLPSSLAWNTVAVMSGLLFQTRRTKGAGGLQRQIFSLKLTFYQLTMIMKRKKQQKIYKSYQIPRKLLVTLLVSTSTIKLILIDIVSFLMFFIFYHDDYYFGKQSFIKPCLLHGAINNEGIFHWGLTIPFPLGLCLNIEHISNS